MNKHDIIVIGARIAGSILAAALGEKGYDVLVLDRTKFPSDTLSTHFFRAPALRAFKSVGVLDEVLSAAPRLKVNFNVIDGIEFAEPVDRPDDYPFYMCVPRIKLDDILTRHIRAIPSVEFREGIKVKGLLRSDDAVSGIKWEGDGESGEETGRVIVGADGVNSFLAKNVDLQEEHREPVNRAMYYAYFRGLPPKEGPAAEFHYNGNTLAYCFPCGDDLTLLAASVPIARFGTIKRNPGEEFKNIIGTMKALAPRVEKAVMAGPVRGSGNIAGYMRVPYGRGWALAGDAAMVMDPWSGQGIDQASTHSVMLAESLDQYLTGKSRWETAMKAYHAARNEFSLKTYQRTCKFSVDLRPMTEAALQRRGLSFKKTPG